MPDAKTLNQCDAKLVKCLGEAHAKEAELEADLATHISLTEKAAYKKRLQAHLKETRDHKRRVAAQIKKLGGPTGQGLLNPHRDRRRRRGQDRRRGQGAGGRGSRARHRAGRDPSAQCAGRAPRGAHRDRDLHPHRGSGHRGRRPRDGAAGARHPPRRGAHGEVPRRRAGPTGQGPGARRDTARSARDHLVALALAPGVAQARRPLHRPPPDDVPCTKASGTTKPSREPPSRAATRSTSARSRGTASTRTPRKRATATRS